MLHIPKNISHLLKITLVSWRRHNAPLLAAGLSYYTVFSATPLVIILIAVVGLVFGKAAAEGLIVKQLGVFVNPEIASAIQSFVRNATHSGMGKATVFSLVLLFYGAIAVFLQLQRALNMIWGIPPPEWEGVRKFIKNYLLLFAMVISVGVLLLAFFLVNASLATLLKQFGHSFFFAPRLHLWKSLNSLLQFGVVTALFAGIFRFLPTARLRTRDLWVGATVTSLILALWTNIIGLYFRFSDFRSIYGVAASVVIIYIWVYFSAQAFLLGAEFTWHYAQRREREVRASASSS